MAIRRRRSAIVLEKEQANSGRVFLNSLLFIKIVKIISPIPKHPPLWRLMSGRKLSRAHFSQRRRFVVHVSLSYFPCCYFSKSSYDFPIICFEHWFCTPKELSGSFGCKYYQLIPIGNFPNAILYRNTCHEVSVKKISLRCAGRGTIIKRELICNCSTDCPSRSSPASSSSLPTTATHRNPPLYLYLRSSAATHMPELKFIE